MSRRALTTIFLALGMSLSSPVALLAESISCPGNDVIVLGADESAEEICEAASEAKEHLASCNLSVPDPVTVEITNSMPGNCLGLYHCDDNLVQLLPIEAYATHLASSPDSLFGHLEPEVFFESVLRHELVHASLETMPCPYEACPATKEFAAYTMQVWFLPVADRAPFDLRASEVERPAFRDGVSAMALMMVPELFIANAYAYLTQQDDPCRLMSKVSDGEIIFDLPPR